MTPTVSETEALRVFVRAHGHAYLDDPNVTSVGVGLKRVDGASTDQVCVQFTVASKVPASQVESVSSQLLPAHVVVAGREVPTDVVERRFVPAGVTPVGQPGEPVPASRPGRFVPEAEDPERVRRHDPVVPGVSMAHVQETAGTFGAVVYDETDATALALSNWHVLQGPDGSVGDEVVQPGPPRRPAHRGQRGGPAGPGVPR